MIQRIRTLMRKEFLELRQSPRLLGLLIVAPVLQLVMLGYAATTDVVDVPILVVDGDRSGRSRQLIERFSASPHFRVVGEEFDPRAVDEHLAQGRVWLAVVIPRGFERAIERGGGPDAAVQILADGTDATSSGVALASAGGIITASRKAVARRRSKGASESGSIRSLKAATSWSPVCWRSCSSSSPPTSPRWPSSGSASWARSSSCTSRRSAGGS
jgi:ABC-2 type transport system permease protein